MLFVYKQFSMQIISLEVVQLVVANCMVPRFTRAALQVTHDVLERRLTLRHSEVQSFSILACILAIDEVSKLRNKANVWTFLVPPRHRSLLCMTEYGENA